MHRRIFPRLSPALASATALVIVIFCLLRPIKAEVSIAGVVNSDVVTFSQIRELVGEEEKVLRTELKGEELVHRIQEIRLAAINELIDRALILQEFKKKGSQISEDVVDERIATIIGEKYGGEREGFLRHIAAEGYTLGRIREFERDKIIVVEMRREAIAGKIKVTEAEIARNYRQYDASGKSLKERHDEIERVLVEHESRRIQEEWIQGLRKGAYIKIYGTDGL